MSDAIKAALDAAQKQANRFYITAETAQIIAAFLRALPVHHMREQVPGGFKPDGMTTKQMAAAIERAVLEARGDG